MANPAPRPAPQPSPTSAPTTPMQTARRLNAVRHGNDDWSVTEQTLEGDGRTWRTVAERPLCAHKSRNVASTYVEEWVRQWAGLSWMGDTGL